MATRRDREKAERLAAERAARKELRAIHEGRLREERQGRRAAPVGSSGGAAQADARSRATIAMRAAAAAAEELSEIRQEAARPGAPHTTRAEAALAAAELAVRYRRAAEAHEAAGDSAEAERHRGAARSAGAEHRAHVAKLEETGGLRSLPSAMAARLQDASSRAGVPQAEAGSQSRGRRAAPTRAPATPPPMGATPADQRAPDDPEYVRAHHIARRMSAIADETGDADDHAEAQAAHEVAAHIARERLTGDQRDRAVRRHEEARSEHRSTATNGGRTPEVPPPATSAHQVVLRGASSEQRVEVQGPPASKPAETYADQALRADQQARRAAVLRGIAARRGDPASVAAADRAEAHAVRLHEQAAASAPTPEQRASHEGFVSAVRGTPAPERSAEPTRSAEPKRSDAVAATREMPLAARLAEHERRVKGEESRAKRKAQDLVVGRAEMLHRGLTPDASYAKRSRALKALSDAEAHARQNNDHGTADRLKSMREEYIETRKARRHGLVTTRVAPSGPAPGSAGSAHQPAEDRARGPGSRSKGRIVQGKKGGKYILLPSGRKRYIK